MHRIDPAAGTIELDGVIYPLKDVHLPTLDPRDEAVCLERLRTSFLASQKLADHVRWMTARGACIWFVKGTPIFHGCVPVDEQGDNLSMVVAGRLYCGKGLFDAIEREVYRLVERPPFVLEELDFFGTYGVGRNRRSSTKIASRPFNAI
jgi:fructose-1,6-bisphosphatase-3